MKIWFTILYLSIATDMTASLILALKFWALRNGRQTWLVRSLAGLFMALFFRGLLEIVAITFGFKTKPEFTFLYGLFYWSGRAVVTCALWYMMVRLINDSSIQHVQKLVTAPIPVIPKAK